MHRQCLVAAACRATNASLSSRRTSAVNVTSSRCDVARLNKSEVNLSLIRTARSPCTVGASWRRHAEQRMPPCHGAEHPRWMSQIPVVHVGLKQTGVTLSSICTTDSAESGIVTSWGAGKRRHAEQPLLAETFTPLNCCGGQFFRASLHSSQSFHLVRKAAFSRVLNSKEGSYSRFGDQVRSGVSPTGREPPDDLPE